MVRAPKVGAAYPILDVRVIARSTLSVFWREHPDAEQQLRAWFHEAEAADWRTPPQAQGGFPQPGLPKGGRVVFDIGGNRFRLVGHCRDPYVFVRFIGTHAEYDRID